MMMHRTLSFVAPLALLLACTTADHVPSAPGSRPVLHAFSLERTPWSAPANIGAPVNTAANEMQPALSPDGLSLYFTSNQAAGALGLNDIWVSHRDCEECPWEAPANLGGPINTASNDAGASLSIDGHLLFFYSNRDASGGAGDIYVSSRANPKEDFGWGTPVKLGPEVNTEAFEAGPEYLQSAEGGAANLYFGRQPVGGAFSMYQVAVNRDGQVRGEAVLIPELSPGTGPTIRTDGREVIFLATRPEGLGLQDLYASTRRSVHESWSAATNLGAPMNSTVMDRHPSLSGDARTLHFASNRPGGLGGDDIWISTRTVNGK